MTTSPWKVTVFGAGGALGRRVLPLLRKAGCETTAFVRGSADRLPPASRAAVDRVVVGDAFLDREAVQEACADADAVVSMLTPRPPSLRFVELLTGCTENIVDGVVAAGGVQRIVTIGGAGVMSRSSGHLVTETFPGSLIGNVLPIYGDFFDSHVYNLQLLRDRLPPPPPPQESPSASSSSSSSSSSSLAPPAWVMFCPGFLRDDDGNGGGDDENSSERSSKGADRVSSPFDLCFGGGALDDDGGGGGVRLWENVNDERFGGLSVTYRDLARAVVREAGPPGGASGDEWRFTGGTRVGIESTRGYYLSLLTGTLDIAAWQAERWQNQWGRWQERK